MGKNKVTVMDTREKMGHGQTLQRDKGTVRME